MTAGHCAACVMPAVVLAVRSADRQNRVDQPTSRAAGAADSFDDLDRSDDGAHAIPSVLLESDDPLTLGPRVQREPGFADGG